MFSRSIKWLGAMALGLALLVEPSYAAKPKAKEIPKETESKPVFQYILVVVLLAVPIGVICRSSRR